MPIHLCQTPTVMVARQQGQRVTGFNWQSILAFVVYEGRGMRRLRSSKDTAHELGHSLLVRIGHFLIDFYTVATNQHSPSAGHKKECQFKVLASRFWRLCTVFRCCLCLVVCHF